MSLEICPITLHKFDCIMYTGKWPDNPRAYVKAKAAMGCQLADELASGFGLHAHPSEHCIDVLADGFAFRIFLASERYVNGVLLHPSCSPTLLLLPHWSGLELAGSCPFWNYADLQHMPS